MSISQKKVKACVGFLFFICEVLPHFSFEIDTVLQKRITLSQERSLLLAVESFVKTENDLFIIADYKDGSFKVYDDNGKLLTVWGRRGPGPLEFSSPVSTDYQKPLFAISDFTKQRIFIYETIARYDFKKVTEFVVPVLDKVNIKLIDNQVLISGYIPVSENKAYCLYAWDPKTRDIQYILPEEVKYGFPSFREFNSKKGTVLDLGSAGFCDVLGDSIYFIWEGNLKVIKINRTAKTWESFGEKTPNYRQPEVTQAVKDAIARRSLKDIEAEYSKMSFVNGIFADEKFVGVIYQNYDRKISLWRMFLQLYTPAGKLIQEEALPDAVTYIDFRANNSFYDRARKRLYYLSIRYDKESGLDKYEILEYQIGL